MLAGARRTLQTVAQRRGLHHVVFVEDHSVLKGNPRRTENLEGALKKLESTLKKDTATLVHLNTAFARPPKMWEVAKGEFSASCAADIEGADGPSAIWSNIHKVLGKREDGDIRLVIVTNAADNSSRHPLNDIKGSAELLRMLSTGDKMRAGLRYQCWMIGLDVTRQKERAVMKEAALWSGGDALFIDCDGADNDGTTLTSPEADQFFKNFDAPISKSTKAAASEFASIVHPATTLREFTHITPKAA